MRLKRNHLRILTQKPATAQTVQQLKYETLLVYMESAYIFADGGLQFFYRANNFFADLSPNIPYKNFFGSGGGSGGGGNT